MWRWRQRYQFLRNFSSFNNKLFSLRSENIKNCKNPNKNALLIILIQKKNFNIWSYGKPILTILNRGACTWNRYKTYLFELQCFSGIKLLLLAQSMGVQPFKKKSRGDSFHSQVQSRGRGTGTTVLGRRRTSDGEGRGTEAFLRIRPLQVVPLNRRWSF